MATHERIFQKMHEYETRVLLALGFDFDSPVLLREVSAEDEYVSFAWYGASVPDVVPRDEDGLAMLPGYLSSDGPPVYRIPVEALNPAVWEFILWARREWESNFPRVLHP